MDTRQEVGGSSAEPIAPAPLAPSPPKLSGEMVPDRASLAIQAVPAGDGSSTRPMVCLTLQTSAGEGEFVVGFRDPEKAAEIGKALREAARVARGQIERNEIRPATSADIARITAERNNRLGKR